MAQHRKLVSVESGGRQAGGEVRQEQRGEDKESREDRKTIQGGKSGEGGEAQEAASARQAGVEKGSKLAQLYREFRLALVARVEVRGALFAARADVERNWLLAVVRQTGELRLTVVVRAHREIGFMR